MQRLRLAALLTAGLLVAPMTAHADQVILTSANIIGASGFYGGPVYTGCCGFEPDQIVDQQTGPVTEHFGSGYWLAPDNGPANAYITIDLGSPLRLTGFQLYNTHNGQYGDRGTGDFSIYGSNSITGGLLDAPSLILSGTLAPASVAGALAAQSFAASGIFRYLSFNPTSVSTAPDGYFGPHTTCPSCGPNAYGLNELKVYAAVPEPSTWPLMISGFGIVGFGMRRRSPVAA